MLDEPLLGCAGLNRRFGERLAVDDVSFSLASGGIYGLLGPKGAGRTTTIKMVSGLSEPDRGTMTIGGRPAAGDLSVRSLVGYVPQDVALYPDLTARENLAFLGRLYRSSRCSPRRARLPRSSS
ncbi:MAG: ATP-binding cassette domain-containing protein [Acidimicrobiales bacterium]